MAYSANRVRSKAIPPPAPVGTYHPGMLASRFVHRLAAAFLVASVGACRCDEAAATSVPRGGPIQALYRHLETTGPMNELTLSDGTSIVIEFAAESSAVPLAALEHLTSHCNDGRTSFIFGSIPPEHAGYGGKPFRQQLHVRGMLDPVVRTDSQGVTFQRFTLEDWFVKTPVEVAVAVGPPGELEPVVTNAVHTSREASCPPLSHEGRPVDMEQFFRAGW